MRILVVAESFLPAINGVTNSVIRIVDYFAAAGHEVRIVAPNAAGVPRVHRTASGHSVPVTRVRSVPMVGYGEVRMSTTTNLRLGKIMQEFRPDVVHLACPTLLGGAAARAANRLGIPSVGIYQTDLPGYTAKYGVPFLEAAAWKLMRDVHNRCTVNLAPSRATRAQIESHGIMRVKLWRRGVDTSLFGPERARSQVRESLAPSGEKLVVYVGRLAAEKQVEDLRVLDDTPGVRLVIVGEGPERPRLERLLTRAHFTGFLRAEALAEVVASCDLFVHTGELETFCQAIQEAMASGLPAIAPRSGGPIDLIDHSRNGWLYEPGNLEQLRAYVRDLVGDDAKRAAFARAARDSVRRRTWPVLSEQLLGFYQQAIHDHATHGARTRSLA